MSNITPPKTGPALAHLLFHAAPDTSDALDAFLAASRRRITALKHAHHFRALPVDDPNDPRARQAELDLVTATIARNAARVTYCRIAACQPDEAELDLCEWLLRERQLNRNVKLAKQAQLTSAEELAYLGISPSDIIGDRELGRVFVGGVR